MTQKDELAWDPKKFHKQELQDMYSSPNVIRVEHVRDRKVRTGFSWRKVNLKNLSTEGSKREFESCGLG